MKTKIFALILCLALVLSCFAGCAQNNTPGGSDDVKTVSADDASKDYNGRELDVLFMVGGQGQMADPILAKLEEVFPGLETTVTYDHNAADILRNRVMADDAPDIFDVNTGMYDYYSAIDEGVMKPLDFVFKAPCVDDPSKTLGDILNFSMMGFGYVDGTNYCMADSVYTSGLWYDANMFREKGYDVPATWDEFIAVGEDAKADGKFLLSFSTRYGSEYFGNYWFNPLLCSIDLEAFGKTQALAENAYDDPAVVKALTLTKDLMDKGYFDTVGATLDITETQMEFCNGNVLFYACGSWLEAEMAGNWPDGFELTYMPFPVQKEGDPSYNGIAGVKSAVSATTKNADLVQEYYRYFYSNAETTKKVVEIHQNGLPIADFSKNYGDLLPESVSSCWASIDSGQVLGYQNLVTSFYASITDLLTDSISALNADTISVDDFCGRMNTFYNDTRADDSIPIRDYDLSALMEMVKNYSPKQ